MLVSTQAYAHDFSTTVGGQRLYFDITNKAKRTATVTYPGSISDENTNPIAGKVEIPSKVRYDSILYDITAISPKAFAGAKSLKGIVIPSGVESIGDFAFEGCDSLISIVFPGNPVTFGQGVFFRCPSIETVTFGSDWKAIDFTMFRWSSALREVHIPAKTERVQGVKRLKKLTEITVDPNNGKFMALDGMLYSKDGKTLYACPRARSGEIVINEATETVTPGALIDCTEITSIDFPSSLKSLSFRESSRMKKLKSVKMRPLLPPTTAYINEDGKFLLQIDSEDVIIYVPAESKKAYESAIATAEGEYSDSIGSVPYTVAMQQMPTKKSLKKL